MREHEMRSNPCIIVCVAKYLLMLINAHQHISFPRLNFLPGNAILKRRLQKSQWKEKEKEREETDIASG